MPIARWLHQVFGQPSYPRVKYRLQGNQLHLLLEADPCPVQNEMVQKVLQALQATPLANLLPDDHPAVYQVVLYGRSLQQSRPDWQETLNLNQLSYHWQRLQQRFQAAPESTESPETVDSTAQSEITSPEPAFPPAVPDASLMLSNRSMAQRGDVEAIARYLSETLSSFGIGVNVSAKASERAVFSEALAPVWTMAGFQPAHAASLPTQRLWITCDASYSPTPSLIAKPLVQQLQDLNLTGFRDAVVQIQVQGETRPDWMLRVDLTPKEERLREWARWGDVEAISRILEPVLTAQNARLLTATLKQSTLHLFCTGTSLPSTLPDESAIRAGVASLLESLAPQGIQQAVLYGQPQADAEPTWVQWLDLPASMHPALAELPMDLAQTEDWSAIAFLLTRVLNPDLDQYLATGGIRVQLLPKDDLLHVMCDAAVCPEQRQVGRAIAKFIKPLNLPSITGVRVYGRRSGQKRPAWSYGSDFAQRERYVPQPAPEFAVTDALVGELVAPVNESIFLLDVTPTEVRAAGKRWVHQTVQQVQNVLVRSQIFTLHPDVRAIVRHQPANDQPTGLRTSSARQSLKAASVWAAAGLLLMVQTTWLMSGLLQRDRQQASAQQQAELASVFQAPAAEPDPQPAPDTAFTEIPTSPSQRQQIILASSPILPSADIALATAEKTLDLPTFNSQQLDQKLALYYQRVAEEGPPDVLVVGSSRALRGVDPVALSEALAKLGYADVSVFNFGINGATAQVVELVLQRLLTPEQLPKLIIWADGARALNSGREDVTYNGIVSSDGYQLLASGAVIAPSVSGAVAKDSATSSSGLAALGASYQALDRWLSDQLATRIPAYDERDRLKSLIQNGMMVTLPTPPLDRQMRQAGSSTTDAARLSDLALTEDMVDINGFLPLDLQFNPATYYQEYARVSGGFDRDYDGFRLEGQQTAALDSVLQVTQRYNVPLVFVNLPLTDQYLDSVRKGYEQEFKQYMFTEDVSQGALVFRDLGEAWPTEYRYFSDPSHLNRYGAYAVSLRLAQDPMIPWAVLADAGRDRPSEL